MHRHETETHLEQPKNGLTKRQTNLRTRGMRHDMTDTNKQTDETEDERTISKRQYTQIVRALKCEIFKHVFIDFDTTVKKKRDEN